MSELAGNDPVAALRGAAEARRAAESEIEQVGAERVERVTDAYERFDDLLERYREPASGSGRETFQSYVEFEGRLETFVSELPDDLLHREAFEAAEERLDRRRLEERDFDLAREDLEPAREVAELVEAREDAEARYREARRAAEAARREVESEIDSLSAVLAYEDVDLDAPVERLREPIEAYEDAVDEAFRAFLGSASARRVLDYVEATRAYPLVEFPAPPEELARYLETHPAGEEPVTRLLEWAEFTRSKLSHYVEDPPAFRARVGGNRTYLSRLDADPLHVGWPPPAAETLRFRARELVAVVERFADEATVERLHAVRDVARREDYGRLRRAALAREELSADERRGLADGSLREELSSLRERRDRLEAALEAHPA